MRKKILVLEGPAGAGKSHTIQGFNQYHPEVPVLERRKEVNGKRSYDSEYWPFLLDLDYLVSALFRPEDVFLVDRFWINSLVYQPFRYAVPGRFGDPTKFPSPYAVNESLGRLVETAYALYETARLRDWNLGDLAEFHFSYHVILPHRDILENNREISGKQYPFDPALETMRYLRVVMGYMGISKGPFYVTMEKHVVQTYDDYYLKVQRTLDRELADWKENNHV